MIKVPVGYGYSNTYTAMEDSDADDRADCDGRTVTEAKGTEDRCQSDCHRESPSTSV